MIPLAAVLRVVLAMPQCFGEPRDVDRLTVIAQAVATVSDTRDDVAGLLAIAELESALCASVHSGRRRGWAASGLWELEPSSHRHPPFAGLSLADTTHAAGEALWMWRHSYSCGRGLEARFRVYGGRACDSAWAGAGVRARWYRWIASQIYSPPGQCGHVPASVIPRHAAVGHSKYPPPSETHSTPRPTVISD